MDKTLADEIEKAVVYYHADFSEKNLYACMEHFISYHLQKSDAALYKFFRGTADKREFNDFSAQTLARVLGKRKENASKIAKEKITQLFDLFIEKYRDDLIEKATFLNAKRTTFSVGQMRVLSDRVQSWCSWKGWCTITGGIDVSNTEKSANMGVACRIYSNQENHPRFNADITVEEFNSVSNGIWLCPKHADLVENMQLSKVSGEELKCWKEERERSIQAAREGIAVIIVIKKDTAAFKRLQSEFTSDDFIISDGFDGHNVFSLFVNDVGILNRFFNFYDQNKGLFQEIYLKEGTSITTINSEN